MSAVTTLRRLAARDAEEWARLIEAAAEFRACVRIASAHARAGLLPQGSAELATFLRDLTVALDRFADREFAQSDDYEATQDLAREFMRALGGVAPQETLEALRDGFGVDARGRSIVSRMVRP